MKQIFIILRNLLKEVQELQFIDLDKGQLDYYENRPRVAYPCALFDFDTASETITENIQRVTGLLTVRLAFDYSGETAGNTSDAILKESLNYFDVVDAVRSKLHGFIRI